MSDLERAALTELKEVYRSWCNQCEGSAHECAAAPNCSLRAYLLALSPAQPEQAQGWVSVPVDKLKRYRVLLETAAQVGCEPRYADGTETPNGKLCRECADELRVLIFPPPAEGEQNTAAQDVIATSGAAPKARGSETSQLEAGTPASAVPAGLPEDCTCHPDDTPPRPCPRKYAYSECMRAHVARLQAEVAEAHGLADLMQSNAHVWRERFLAAERSAAELRERLERAENALRIVAKGRQPEDYGRYDVTEKRLSELAIDTLSGTKEGTK